MTEDLFSIARKAQGEVEREISAKLGIGSIFEGIGNIINIIGKVAEEGATSQKSEADEKTPVCAHNSQ